MNGTPAKVSVSRLVSAAGSLKLTLVIMSLLATGVAVTYVDGDQSIWWLVAPLAACAVNLAAAIATNAVFRRNLPLLLFHLALLVLVLLLAAGRLTHLKGMAEVVTGGAFEGTQVDFQAGPWHMNRLSDVHFINDGFSIKYAPGLRRGETRNALRYVDAKGALQRVVIGDNQPLTLLGYRFYTSFNKGFAPVFRWHAMGSSEPLAGTVNLPSYPARQYGQAQQWTIPGTDMQLWVMLQFDEPVIDPDKADDFKLPERHTIVLRQGERRWELHPGESIEIAGGTLEYDHLRTWMGYNIFYDWTLPWLLAACVTAVGALGVHFWTRFAAKPWNA